MDSVMNYHFFENEIRIISCAYYPRLLWEERHPPKSYWCFFWNAEEDKSIRFSGEDLPFGGEHGVPRRKDIFSPARTNCWKAIP